MTQASINGFPGVNLAGNNAGLLLSGTGTHQITVTGGSSGRLGQDATGFFFSSDTNGKVIKFLTNNGALNEWMRITSTGNVGIATATPMKPLDVAGSGGIQISRTEAASHNNEIFFQDNGQIRSLDDSHAIVFNRANNTLELREFGNIVLSPGFNNSVGYVGIGTRTPSAMLDVAGNFHVGTGNNSFRVEGPGSGTPVPVLASWGGSGDFAIDSVGAAGGRFVVKDSGNMGIGTATPMKPLDVAGSGGIRVSQAADDNSSNEIFFQDNGRIQSADINHEIAFHRASNILELREFGNIFLNPGSGGGSGHGVGVGTNTPGALFHVTGSETTPNGFGAAIELSNKASTNHWFLRAGAPLGTATPPDGFSIADDKSYKMVINSAGQVGIATGTGPGFLPGSLTIAQNFGNAIADGWSTYSSRRWKMNIHPIPGALAKVERLRGVTYDRKSDGKHEIGVVAEEVGRVVPEVVSYEDNGVDAQGVDYARLTALLIEAVKEQQAQIKQQKAQIKALQVRLRRIETRSN